VLVQQRDQFRVGVRASGVDGAGLLRPVELISCLGVLTWRTFSTSSSVLCLVGDLLSSLYRPDFAGQAFEYLDAGLVLQLFDGDVNVGWLLKQAFATRPKCRSSATATIWRNVVRVFR
jgi:hypothetical protein